jgi:hypothetical protein
MSTSAPSSRSREFEGDHRPAGQREDGPVDRRRPGSRLLGHRAVAAPVGRQHLEQAAQIAVPRRAQERVEDLALPGEVAVRQGRVLVHPALILFFGPLEWQFPVMVGGRRPGSSRSFPPISGAPVGC